MGRGGRSGSIPGDGESDSLPGYSASMARRELEQDAAGTRLGPPDLADLMEKWHTRIGAARNILRALDERYRAEVATASRLESLHRCPAAAAVRQRRVRVTANYAEQEFPARCGRSPCPVCTVREIEQTLARRGRMKAILRSAEAARHVVLDHQRLSVEAAPFEIWDSIDRLKKRCRAFTRRRGGVECIAGGELGVEISPVGPLGRRGVLIHAHLLIEPSKRPFPGGSRFDTLDEIRDAWRGSVDVFEETHVWMGQYVTNRASLRRRLRYVAGLRSISRVRYSKALDGLIDPPEFDQPVVGWRRELAERYRLRGDLTARQLMLVVAFAAHPAKKLQFIRGWADLREADSAR